jgi:hypothetical protein
VVGYSEAKTFGVIAATLRCEGVEGFVQVVPSVVEDNVITWKPFPGTGRPHFDIKVDGVGHQRTCILAEAVRILERWATAKQPLVRGAIESMLPVVRPALEAIAAAPIANVEDAIEIGNWSLTKIGKEQLAAAREGLDVGRIANAFPRDDSGRLVTTRVLLAPIQSTKKLAAGREVFLAVAKREKQLQLVLVDAIDVNETHRWMDARWLWRDDTERPADDVRAMECVALLDAGDFDKALAMYGISVSESAIKVLEGVPTGSHSSHEAESREVLRRVLWSLAAWKLKDVRWGSMALLPHQRHQVKGWISWQPPGEITISGTASNMRLARCRWARDVDQDLARLGIARSKAVAANLPAKKKKVAKPQKPLVDMIAGKPLWTVDTAMKHAKQRPQRETMAELLAIVDSDRKHDERANALMIAAAIAEARDAKTIAAYLDDRSDRVRRMAIDAVKRLGYTAAIGKLAVMVCTKRKEGIEDIHAATAMKTLSGRNGPSGLLGYFASEDPRVREAACRAFEIFDQGQEMARPYLEKALLDDDAAVVAAAKSTFRKFAKRDGG